MQLLNRRSNFGKMNGQATVEGKLAAEATVAFAISDRPGQSGPASPGLLGQIRQ